jgi:hypothetical protein
VVITARFGVAIVLDHADTNLTHLGILNKAALDVSTEVGIIVITADTFEVC